MIPERRDAFNQAWTEAKYERLLRLVTESAGGAAPAFPIAETPVMVVAMFRKSLWTPRVKIRSSRRSAT